MDSGTANNENRQLTLAIIPSKNLIISWQFDYFADLELETWKINCIRGLRQLPLE